jgi:hypothetical protein
VTHSARHCAVDAALRTPVGAVADLELEALGVDPVDPRVLKHALKVDAHGSSSAGVAFAFPQMKASTEARTLDRGRRQHVLTGTLTRRNIDLRDQLGKLTV